MPARSDSKCALLLANPKVRSWYEARSLRSKLSADTDLRKLRLVLERLKLDPESVVSLATRDPDGLQDSLIRYATEMKKKGLLDDYLAKTLSGLKNYLRFRRVQFNAFPVLRPIHSSTLSAERVPTPEELGAVLEHLSLRGRVIALLLAHTGVRPQVIGSYMGERGLVLGDLPELDLDDLTFSEVPFVVRVPADLSKTRVAYTTFGTRQLAAVLSAYLTERQHAGEKLTSTSPVIVSAGGESLRGVARTSRMSVERSHRFLVTGVLVQEVRSGLRATVPKGVTWRPYVLRSYFSTRLLLSPMNRDLRESLMAHRTVSGRYNLAKRWGTELLAEARREYANASEFLETGLRTKIDTKAEVLRSLLEAVESATGSKAGAAGSMSADDLIAALRKTLGGADASVPATPVVAAPRAVQKVVGEAELDGILAAGGRLVAPVGSRFCVEMPSA